MAAPHTSSTPDLARQKAALRAQALQLRAKQHPALGDLLSQHVLASLPMVLGTAVAGVWPLPGEIDLRPLWHALHQRGHTVLLPETPPRGHPLVFRVWHPRSTMVKERFGTERPDGPMAIPDLIFVPLLAFDGQGNRLGYGGGYYDRTLASYGDTQAIGFGYAALRVDKVPVGPHDRKLKTIYTEHGLAVDRRTP
jgi:5-formyltetrahydrofolate cyclo-ligase